MALHYATSGEVVKESEDASNYEVGDFVVKGTSIYAVRKAWDFMDSEKGKTIVFDRVSISGEGNGKTLLEAVLSYHGMKENIHGSYMLDTGSIVKAVVDMKYTLKEMITNLAESNKDVVTDFKEALEEDRSLRSQVKQFDLFERSDLSTKDFVRQEVVHAKDVKIKFNGEEFAREIAFD